MKKLHVNLISESEFTVQGHGVHTAYLEMRNSLERRPDIMLTINAEPQKTADITHAHTMGTFALRRLLSHRGGKKIVSAHLIPDSLYGSIVGSRLLMLLLKPYGKWFYNRADLLIAVSEHTKNELKKMRVKKPIVILENSIDTSKYAITPTLKKQFRKKLKLPQNKFIVVGNGQIQPRKKFDDFLDVARELPDMQFVWIGGIPFKALGADYARMTKLIKNAPKNVRITGVISLSEVREILGAADVMFNPSIQETFGLAIIEGAASGLPVLVRDIPDYDTTFGSLVLRGTPDSYTYLLLKLKNNRNFYKKFQSYSKKIATKYDSEQMTERLTKLYRSILDKDPVSQQKKPNGTKM